MHDLPATRHSLLVRLADPTDREAWGEFAAIYEPAVYRLARSRGLQHADALDLVQEVLWAVAQAIERWTPDPGRARFRTWLFRVARNLAINALTRGGRLRGSGDSGIQKLLASIPAELEEEVTLYDVEFRREAFRRAADYVRQYSDSAAWEAFWLTAVERVAVAEAATRLQTTPGAIYAARGRILARLRKYVEKYEGR
ncbi:MAG: RNA polymerase sigma factor [Planctomycetaceae bacterium]